MNFRTVERELFPLNVTVLGILAVAVSYQLWIFEMAKKIGLLGETRPFVRPLLWILFFLLTVGGPIYAFVGWRRARAGIRSRTLSFGAIGNGTATYLALALFLGGSGSVLASAAGFGAGVIAGWVGRPFSTEKAAATGFVVFLLLVLCRTSLVNALVTFVVVTLGGVTVQRFGRTV